MRKPFVWMSEEVYTRTIAEQFAFEKREIMKLLMQSGIQSILTTPEHLTVDAINIYIELKARGRV
jgi:hypothetical protein